ncbi:rod shape-determining protein RodA [Candidatus Daviesbacteria bacterium]|nr:rod shape-determining protein RodA [Candidatus Daviesbacteria bacterium]
MPFSKIDGVLTLCAVFLSLFGLAMIGSVAPSLFLQQLAFFGVGFLLYLLFSSFDYRIFRHLAPLLYLMTMLFLIFTYFWGLTARGSVRWLTIADFRLQPSEIAKVVLIITACSLLLKFRKNFPVALILSLTAMLLPMLLVFLQPDLGSSMVIASIWLSIILAFGVPKKYLMMGILGLALVIPISWNVLHDYQKQRLVTFVNPYLDPLGSGYHAIQSTIAVGSGQFWGKGFGKGTQSHLQFLPEQYTDFIFATLAEEFGFVGSMIIVALFTILCLRLIFIAQHAPDLFGCLIVVGVLVMILVQTVVNIGMNVGLLPITGITLPLVSYGGSSLISTLIALGIASSVAVRSKSIRWQGKS